MTSLTRRQLFVLCITGTGMIGRVSGAAEGPARVSRALNVFEVTGPHGPVPDLLDHLYLPVRLEQLVFKAKLLGLPVDAARFFDLLAMVHMERYLDDPAYAGQVHAGLRAVCDGGHDQRHTFPDISQKSQ